MMSLVTYHNSAYYLPTLLELELDFYIGSYILRSVRRS